MKLTARPLALAAIVAVAGAVLAYQALMRPQPAPAVTYTRLDGTQGSSAQWRGRVTLVNFWATSCTTCMHEMPRMVQTYQKYKGQGLDTVAVAMSYDTPAYVAQYASSRQLPFQVAFDGNGNVAQRFGDVRLTPTTYVIDKKGDIVKRYVGEPDFQALDQLLAQLLAQPA